MLHADYSFHPSLKVSQACNSHEALMEQNMKTSIQNHCYINLKCKDHEYQNSKLYANIGGGTFIVFKPILLTPTCKTSVCEKHHVAHS